MPYMDGYEVAKRMRATQWGEDAVLVAISGWGQARDRERARAAGFDHHFTKPATLQDLEPVLRDLRRTVKRR
jgi:CheY-like chemotaxis protein